MGVLRRVLGACAVAGAIAMVGAGCAPTPGGPPVQQIDPVLTDSAIRPDLLASNLAIAPVGPARGRLVILFNGNGAGPLALQHLGQELASDGYHVIALRYESAVATMSACPDSVRVSDPNCHRRLRSEVVFGGGVADPTGRSYDHAALNVSAANSVVNRALKLVDYLRLVRPLDGWDTFQQRDANGCTKVYATYGACELNWPKVSTMGHSLGASIALYLAKFFPLDRVGLLSGPFDAFDRGAGAFTVAPWITEAPLKVPASRITTLTHLNDPALSRIRAVATALNLAGPEKLVTKSAPPYSGSHRLTTDATPACPFDSAPNHNATATDLCSPVGVHDAAWRSLAGS